MPSYVILLKITSDIIALIQLSLESQLMEVNWSDPLQLGDLTLRNRAVMAALTRNRCNPEDGVPSQLVAQYYIQRAGAGLILTEATAWSQRGQGFVGAACLFNQAQADGWKKVVEGVHAKGGVIFLQIFHAGRVTHQKKTGGLHPFAPSAIAIREKIRDLGDIDFPKPSEMTLEDIEVTKQQFEASLKLAKEVGFDGVQLHGAHGYLIDEFLRSASNTRTDIYGGSYQNRVRFALELTDIALKYFSSKRIGIKISPASRLKDMYDENPIQTYSYLLQELSKRQIGFIEIRQSTEFYPFPNQYPLTQREQIPDVCAALRPYFNGLIIDNDSFTPQSGIARIRTGLCEAISYGKLYISNPDLAERLINGWEVNSKWDLATFYSYESGPKGYTDYPFYQP